MKSRDQAVAERRRGDVVLMGALLACFPLACVLPQFLSWENGLLEQLQNVILLTGLLVAVWSARELKSRPAAALMWIAGFFWLGFLGRELSWAAVFLPSTGMTQWGPSYAGYDLWWKPYLRAGLLALAVLGTYWFFRQKLWRQVLLRLWREQALPVVPLLVYGLAMLATIHAEGHGLVRLQDWYGLQVMVLEELVETVGYAALWWAQWCVVRHICDYLLAQKLQMQRFAS